MITIVSALKAEIAPLIQKIPVSEKKVLAGGSLYLSDKIHFLRTGIGPRRAEDIFKTYLAMYKPTAMLNLGLAGKLNPSLHIGQIFNISKIFYNGKDTLEAHTEPKLKSTSLLTAEQAVTSDELRKKLFAEIGADLVDMEAYALAKICQKQKIPFCVFKIISDEADRSTEQTFLNNYKMLSAHLAQYVWENKLKDILI